MSKSILTPLAVPAHLNPENVQVRMAGTPDNPLFCLADVCQVLGYKNVAQAVQDWKTTIGESRLSFQAGGLKTKREGRPVAYDKWYCREGDFYRVVLGSGQPLAAPFSTWVCDEVLPCIRKHGCYPAPAVVPELPRPWSLRLSRSFEAHMRFINKHNAGSFSILTAISTPMLVIEDELLDHLLPISRTDLPDGSAGRRWSDRRIKLGWPDVERYAPLFLPGRQIRVDVKIYPGEERAEFDRWFVQEYMPKYMPAYLREKFRFLAEPLVPLSAADNSCRRFCGVRAELPEPTLELIDQYPDKKIRAKAIVHV